MSIAENIHSFAQLPSAVKLVAVSKFKPLEDILEAYGAGQRRFGENRPQEFASKARDSRTPADVEWHFIGHLQTNKVRMVVPYARLIHSIDTEKLLSCVNDCASSIGKVQKCLLEVHISSDATKQGFLPQEIEELSRRFSEFPSVEFCGLMGMASLTEDMDRVRQEFRSLRELRDIVRKDNPSFTELSMGMSHDYVTAIEEGATYIRIGTSIFGARG